MIYFCKTVMVIAVVSSNVFSYCFSEWVSQYTFC